MRTIQLMTWTTVAALILGVFPASAPARTFVSLGFNFGAPVYGGWGWGWGYRPYPYYYPYYGPPPVVYAPAPVYRPYARYHYAYGYGPHWRRY